MENRHSLTALKDSHIPGDKRNQYIVKGMTDPMLWGGAGENYIGVLAYKWNKAADVYLCHQQRMILVKYEDFLLDTYGYITRLAQQLDISKRADIRDEVDVQFQPMGKDRGLPWGKFYSAANLKSIEQICGSGIEKFGYTDSHSHTFAIKASAGN